MIEEVKHLNPQSILDVGCGWGLMGSVFRAYTDIRLSELDSSRYHVWQTKIDAIEIHKAYKNPVWEVYSNIVLGDALTAIDSLRDYDMIYVGDIIEHVTKEQGHIFLQKCLDHSKFTFVATPSPAPKQDAILGNYHEVHRSSWDESDFAGYTHQIIGNYNGILLVKLWK